MAKDPCTQTQIKTASSEICALGRLLQWSLGAAGFTRVLKICDSVEHNIIFHFQNRACTLVPVRGGIGTTDSCSEKQYDH